MSIHNFIKDYDVKYRMDDYICHNDGILWINCDGMWIKQNKTSKALEVKNFVLFSGREIWYETSEMETTRKNIKALHF